MDSRLGRVKWGHDQLRVRTSAAAWKQPIKWNAKRFMQCEDCGWRGEASTPMIGCGACGSIELSDTRRRVFCASLADVFDNEVPQAWRTDLFELIEDTPHLDWLLLTKRIGNVQRMLTDTLLGMRDLKSLRGQQWPWPNVWLGATICNQVEADRDIPKLLAVPARVRFLSIEPMLGDVRLGSWLQRSPSAAFAAGKVTADMPAWTRIGSTALDWVICGGESGPQARPMHPDWVRSLRDQCAAAGVPFHFKQWGEWGPEITGYPVKDSYRWPICADQPGALAYRVGTKHAGRLLDGIEHNGFPA